MKNRDMIIVALAVLSLLASCASPAEKVAPPANMAAFPLQLTDQIARTVIIEKMPQKIISLAPSNTEIVYALGLEDRLVGVTEYCNYPEAAMSKPKIGGFSTVDIEKVVAIQPDLILAANIHRDKVIPELERLGLTVITTDPHTIDEVIAAISLVGRATAKEDVSAKLAAEMQQRVAAVTDKIGTLTEAQRPRVLYIVWHNPLMTIGAQTRINELLAKAGGTSISRDLSEDYPTISLEAVIAADPEVIIAGGGHGDGADAPLGYALNESRLATTAARQNSRVYGIDADLTSRPGPRIVDALEELAKMIHPELFLETGGTNAPRK